MTELPHPSQLAPPTDFTAMAPAALTEPRPADLLPGARSLLNIPYATMIGWRPLLLDLHLPAAPGPGPTPVVVYAHGGSWVGGIKAMGPWHDLPARGIAVASVSYRLAGEVAFPEPVEDIRAAVRWVRTHADRYGLDPARVAGWGSSAGGYLVTMAALAGDTPLGREVVETGRLDGVSSRLTAVVDHYGVADPTRLAADALEPTGPLTTAITAVARQFLGHDPAAEPDRAAAADPLAQADRGSGHPPFLIMHGDADRRVGLNQSRRLHDGLRARGIGSELVVVPGADHAAAEFSGRERVEQAVAFLRRAWSAAAEPR
jgi:acetyl esterase/lipase